jgi:glycosyltransferase involved in cell wall biosynthesis
MKANLHIQHLNLLNSGGAFVAARRISDAIADQGIFSELKTLSPREKNLLQKIGGKGDYLLEKINPQNYTVSHFRTLGTAPVPPQNTDHRNNSQKIVNLHWMAGMNLELILNQALSPSWFWTVHDENVMTSYCHISGNCKQYETECRSCPQAPRILRGRVLQSFKRRARFLEENSSRLTLISPSNWMRNRLATGKNTSKLNVVTVRNPIPLDIFKPALPGAKIRDLEVMHIGYLGSNYAKSKNSVLAFNVLNAFIKSKPDTKFRLVCIGERFEKDPNEGVTRQIQSGSSEEEMAIHFRELDVLLYSSEADNLPNLLVEAQASGVAVIALDVGGVKETFLDGYSGLLCRDFRDLTNALEVLSNSRPKLDFFSRCAREFAEAKFNPSLIGKQYIELYQS